MKKLSKIKLQNAIVLEESVMKTVFGGSGGSGSGSGWCCFRDGECVLTGCNSDSDCSRWYGEGSCRH